MPNSIRAFGSPVRSVQLAIPAQAEVESVPVLRRLQSYPLGAVLILAIWVLAALFAPIVAPHDPLATSLPARFRPPVLFGGSWDHVLGTDNLGRDLLSRIIYGARLSLLLGLSSLLLGMVVGTAVGLVAGYAGGWLDALLIRLADLTISFPIILLALLLAVVVGTKASNVVVVISLVIWARFARVVRGEVLVVRETAYVALARVAGASHLRIIVRHILPNVFATIIVLATLQLGFVIIAEASLSFIGAGVPLPQPAWGSMTAEGMAFLADAWWMPTVPALTITLVVLAVNVAGDWLRDRFDARQVL
jgi:peptide/nickel transport system permease protein